MEILKVNQKNFKKIIAKVVESLENGEVIICPTDTVYGLICDATNKKAVARIFKIKKRSFQKPLSIFVKNLKAAKKYSKINKNQEKFLKKSWPGKTIAILKAKVNFPDGIVCQWGKIGLRMPKYKLLNEILDKFKRPIAQTSANISGKATLPTIQDILNQFKNKKWLPDIAINAGELSGKSSKVIDLTTSHYKILRQ